MTPVVEGSDTVVVGCVRTESRLLKVGGTSSILESYPGAE